MTDRKYSYQNAQESVLIPFYRRFVWQPLLERLPATLSPNAITVISTVCCGGSFVLATTADGDPLALVVAAFLVFAYCTLDNVDGAQARKIGRSSRLGEFLDHWLDTFNNGFVVLGACLAAGLPPLLVLTVLGVTTLAFNAVQLELRETGVFRMGRLGDVEGNTVVSLLYLALAAVGPGFFQATPIPGLPSLAVWLGIGVMGQAVLAYGSAVRRVTKGRVDLLPPAVIFAVLLAWAALGDVTPAAHLAAGFFVNPICTSRPVRSRVLAEPGPPTDWIATGLAAGVAGLDLLGLAPASSSALMTGVALVYAAIGAYHFFGVTRALRLEARGTHEPAGDEVVAGGS